MKKISIFAVFMMIAMSVLTACHDDHDDYSSGNAETRNKAMARRTVLVYISGENDLDRMVLRDMAEMKEGSKGIGDNNLILFVDRCSDKELPWMARLKNGQVTDSVSIADMGISTHDEYASDPRVFESVLRYAFNHYAAEDYGLVLWGHSTGWLIEDEVKTRAYGIDNGKNDRNAVGGYWLNIPTMGKILSRMPHLKFIMADCCNFMCLEVLYELRNVTDYILGSPAEIPSFGAPYNTVIPALFERTSFATSAIDRYHAAYIDKLPLTVAKTGEMENLAQATRTVLRDIKANKGDGYPDMTGTIHYNNNGGNSMNYNPADNIFYDAGDFINSHAAANSYKEWKKVLDRVVIQKYSAQSWSTFMPWSVFFNDFTVTSEKFHGVSMFVPQSPQGSVYASYNHNIRSMAWYNAAGLQEMGW